jgi:hypothetical protein
MQTRPLPTPVRLAIAATLAGPQRPQDDGALDAPDLGLADGDGLPD